MYTTPFAPKPPFADPPAPPAPPDPVLITALPKLTPGVPPTLSPPTFKVDVPDAAPPAP